MAYHNTGIIFLASIAMTCVSAAQQISIPRIELMPNKPSPYLMRDWKGVAIGYDSLVFNSNLTGKYLPLVSVVGQNFSLSSYVGQSPSQTKEAINCIPAVVSASLVGIDKTNQFGFDWVSACQNWFNQSPQEDVYLNNPGGSSGSDWWYDMMPNVFFYQLYSMYPTTGNFRNQFVTVANRWLAALNAMGAGTTPWTLANLNHTAWNLSTMTPTNSGWVEPEAGGTIAWLLYSAYVQTGNVQYRIGAELAMESLLAYPVAQNPSYELQLPYGAYIAARMNAELGTTYDIEKIVTWCFSDGSDNSRLWGVTVGNWGGYDCDGLIGETGYGSGNGYPFVMNTFEQCGALVPLVRYDARFARIIGKWVLNAANAARLFYTNYLPDQNQDGAAWSHQYDPQSYIAHESMHQHDPINPAIVPYATGDAIGNGNPTNFALYGSSHAGIFGGVIDTTDVPMILRLDVLKTDYFHTAAYPTFLLFNPDSVQHSVSFDAGSGQHDLYDAASHSYILKNISGVVALPINANSAVLVVNTPASVTPTYNLDQMLINGIVVDYHSGHATANYPPRIKSLTPDSNTVLKSHSTLIFCTATDNDNDTLSYSWKASGGSIVGSGSIITWNAPDTAGAYVVQCVVSDTHGAQTSAADTITVVQSINHPPVIQKMNASPGKIDLGATSTISCFAMDPDSNTLTYHWSTANGLLTGTGSIVSWQSPQTGGNYYIQCTVDDGHGGTAADSVGLEVRDFSNWQTGNLVAYYPFNADTKDASGYHHDGTANGGSFTSDRFGHPASAYSFDGATTSIIVPDDSTLNFQSGITVNFWMKVGAFYSSREQYVISHGSWQNRWKFSISPNTNTLRWTVKNSLGVAKDLDSPTQLVLDSLYNVTGSYNGSDFEIYVNGQLDAFTSFSGLINTTTVDLTIGQDLPGDNAYDFNGVLDDIRIYNYMLPVSQISAFYDINTGIVDRSNVVAPSQFALAQNFPNPFNPTTTIRFAIPSPGFVTLKVFDVLGREIATLIQERVAAGEYSVPWNAARCASGVYYYKLEAANVVLVKKMILLR
ncbi:MAG: LamG-like jellyroll fold domain-containing protein [Bacteroidota bacterium]